MFFNGKNIYEIIGKKFYWFFYGDFLWGGSSEYWVAMFFWRRVMVFFSFWIWLWDCCFVGLGGDWGWRRERDRSEGSLGGVVGGGVVVGLRSGLECFCLIFWIFSSFSFSNSLSFSETRFLIDLSAFFSFSI